MIKHATRYDHSKKEWIITPKLTFKSKYKSYCKREFRISDYRFSSPSVGGGLPLLGPTCLTVWSK